MLRLVDVSWLQGAYALDVDCFPNDLCRGGLLVRFWRQQKSVLYGRRVPSMWGCASRKVLPGGSNFLVQAWLNGFCVVLHIQESLRVKLCAMDEDVLRILHNINILIIYVTVCDDRLWLYYNVSICCTFRCVHRGSKRRRCSGEKSNGLRP